MSSADKDELNDLLNPKSYDNNQYNNEDVFHNPFASANDNASMKGITSSSQYTKGTSSYDQLDNGADPLSSGYDRNDTATVEDTDTFNGSTKPLKSLERLSIADTTGSMNTGGHHVTNHRNPIDEEEDDGDLSIQVGDPMTIGEGMKAHTVYTVTLQCKRQVLQFGQMQMSVQRRFKEFLWLQSQLATNNQGVIVPPAPDKQAVGRFAEGFVENRRALLERMMKKIARHSVLAKDPTFVKFMEQADLDTSEKSTHVKKESKSGGTGFMSKLGDAMSSATGSTKVEETDPWFETKKTYIDNLETQLKNVAKAVDSMIKDRSDLAESAKEFGESIFTLASSEINKSVEKQLVEFGEAQKAIEKIHAQQSGNDQFYLSNTFDEYVRTMQSVKFAFQTRQKLAAQHQNAIQNLSKLKISLEKTKMNRTKQEKIAQIESEIQDAEIKIVEAKKEFDQVSEVIKQEMVVFERVKVMDMEQGMKGFLETLVQSHDAAVQVWDNFLKNIS